MAAESAAVSTTKFMSAAAACTPLRRSTLTNGLSRRPASDHGMTSTSTITAAT